MEQKGLKLSKKFNLYSDITEMRTEYMKIKKDVEISASLKVSKRVLLAVVTGSEFLNNKFDPFGFELDGWSETVMTNMNDGDFDVVLERLCEKYSGRFGNVPPEIELMMALVGSAAMFHVTNTMFKPTKDIPGSAAPSTGMPSMQSMMKAVQRQQQQQPVPDERNEGPREMRGPSINLSQFGGVFGAPADLGNDLMGEEISGQLPPPPVSARVIKQDIREQFNDNESIFSDNSDFTTSSQSTEIKEVSFVTEGGTKKRGRKPKINATKENTLSLNL
jgi:hypothetical protein